MPGGEKLMKFEKNQAVKLLFSLSEQLESLLGCLRGKDDHWIESRFRELSTFPEDLEAHVSRILATVSELRCRLQESGHATIKEWERAEWASQPAVLNLTGSLRETLHQTRQVAQAQQLLARNLLAYVHGLTLLMKSKQDPTYAESNALSDRGHSLQLRG